MEENELSQSYLERFARLLRMLLENADQPFIPLKKEINFLKLYLSLESLRIPDLQYSIEMDPGLNTEKTKIPNISFKADAVTVQRHFAVLPVVGAAQLQR